MGIGKRVKEARERLHLTQKELADQVGVTSSAIANYESEVSHPKEPVLYALLGALQVDANFLFQDCIDIKTHFDCTLEEQDLLRKFRALDSYAQEPLKLLLEREYGRLSPTDRRETGG